MRRQLGQLRPANTSAASLFSPSKAGQYTVEVVVVANVSSSPADASIFHDRDGSTYDQDTAIVYQYTIPANGVMGFEIPMSDYEVSGNIGVQSSVGDALNFTGYGTVDGERL